MLKWFVNCGWWLGNRHSPLRRGISLVFSLSSLVLFSACTDYVSQIEDRYGEWKIDPSTVEKGLMTDSRDGQTYETVKIGTQMWMAQNLNYETANSYCYRDSAKYCSKYGRYYTWAAAKKACPSGWHLPTEADFKTLIGAVGGSSDAEGGIASYVLKSTNGWNDAGIDFSGNGTDDYSFAAFPAGIRYYSNGDYGVGSSAEFWSSTEDDRDSDCAVHLYLGYTDVDNYASGEILYGIYKENGLSVRCIKDEKFSLSAITTKSSSSQKAKSSSSSIKSSSSISQKSSSSVAKLSSSSVVKSSSSVKASSSSRVPMSSSKVVGTCAPDKAAANVGDKVSWKFTKDDNVSSTDLLSATFQWTFEGGTPDNVTAKGANGVSQQVTYTTSGEYRASLVLSIASDSYLVTCSPVHVAEQTAKSSSSVKASSSSVAKSSSSVKVASSSSVSNSSSSSVEVVDPADVVVGSMTDSRDGQKYKTVKIGTQTWFAQNLNYETENSRCGGGRGTIEGDCSKYGRLYTWAAAVGKTEDACGNGHTCSLPLDDIQGVCSSGWHLPSQMEWNTLFAAVGGSSTAGKVLKSTSGWSGNGNGTDAFSFSALPAGTRSRNGIYLNVGYNTNFWSSTELSSIDGACGMYLSDSSDYAYLNNLNNKGMFFSVRCLKD